MELLKIPEKMGRLVEAAHEYANFFKHADKDPAGVLESFSDSDTDMVLFIACHDFLRVAKGQPVELQVFEAWWFATAHARVSDAPLRSQKVIRRCIQMFPGIRAADRRKRQTIGLAALEKAYLDPKLIMDIEREVKFPVGELIQKSANKPAQRLASG